MLYIFSLNLGTCVGSYVCNESCKTIVPRNVELVIASWKLMPDYRFYDTFNFKKNFEEYHPRKVYKCDISIKNFWNWFEPKSFKAFIFFRDCKFIENLM